MKKWLFYLAFIPVLIAGKGLYDAFNRDSMEGNTFMGNLKQTGWLWRVSSVGLLAYFIAWVLAMFVSKGKKV